MGSDRRGRLEQGRAHQRLGRCSFSPADLRSWPAPAPVGRPSSKCARTGRSRMRSRWFSKRRALRTGQAVQAASGSQSRFLQVREGLARRTIQSRPPRKRSTCQYTMAPAPACWPPGPPCRSGRLPQTWRTHSLTFASTPNSWLQVSAPATPSSTRARTAGRRNSSGSPMRTGHCRLGAAPGAAGSLCRTAAVLVAAVVALGPVALAVAVRRWSTRRSCSVRHTPVWSWQIHTRSCTPPERPASTRSSPPQEDPRCTSG